MRRLPNVWIGTVYKTTDPLKASGQRIVYLLNPHVGIFVSASVAPVEHRAIPEHVHELEALGPGLYEMKIEAACSGPVRREAQHAVRVEPRRLENIRYEYPRASFGRVRDLPDATSSSTGGSRTHGCVR